MDHRSSDGRRAAQLGHLERVFCCTVRHQKANWTVNVCQCPRTCMETEPVRKWDSFMRQHLSPEPVKWSHLNMCFLLEAVILMSGIESDTFQTDAMYREVCFLDSF